MAVTAVPARPVTELRDRFVRRAEVVGVWAVDCIRAQRGDTDWAAELLGDIDHRLEHATLEEFFVQVTAQQAQAKGQTE